MVASFMLLTSLFSRFWIFVQKSPSSNEGLLGDACQLNSFSRFFYEAPGGSYEPRGDKTRLGQFLYFCEFC